MCGISGLQRADGSLRASDQSLIKKMNDTLRQRGPDGEGFYASQASCLGHRRLAIIDLHSGGQPIFNEDRSLAIVFNGEIYNYQDLRIELQKQGHRFTTESDTEVILHLYEEYGENALTRLNGIFAFAILNTQTEDLFLARDPFGVKPLYYTQTRSGDFAFASELKALLPFLGEQKPRLDLMALNNYLSFEHVPAPQTIYQEIRKLEAGTWAKFKGGKLQIQEYYSLHFQPKFSETTERFYTDKLDSLLSQAVHRQRISDVPLGAFLSGGIDSSLIAFYLAREAKLQTFSIAFEDPSFDESRYSRLMADFLKTEHHEYLFSARELLDSLPAITEYMDEPFADASLLPTFLLAKHTRRFVTVALSGDGSDEIFAGYPTYYARKVARWIPSFIAPISYGIASLLPVSDKNISFDFKLKRFTRGLLEKNSDLRHQVWLGAFDRWQKHQLLNPDVLASLGSEVDTLSILENHMRACDASEDWQRSLWCDARFYLQDNMLVKADRASMMNSLEVRVPFLDPDLANFAFRMPAHLKYRGGTSKYILKQMARRHLPPEIIDRPKKGFGIPIAKWIKQDLNPLFRETLLDPSLRSQGLFEPTYIAKLLQEHERGQADHRKLLWPLFVFQRWQQMTQ